MSVSMCCWGNTESKLYPEKVLFESDQIMVIEFSMLCKDDMYYTTQQYGFCEQFYIHKKNGLYSYIGQIKFAKLLRVAYGVASYELVVAKAVSYTHLTLPTKRIV